MMRRNHPAHMPKIIAHRGVSASVPENTLSAFSRAAALGAQAVELDATVSRDGIAVVLHDETLERCTHGHGFVILKTIEELSRLDAGAWFAPQFAGEHVPLLSTVLALVAERGMALNLEIKPTLGWEEPTARAVADAVRAVWPQGARLLVSSMSPLALDTFHALMADVALGLITTAVPENWRERMQSHNCSALHCHHAFVTPGLACDLHDAGYRLHVYTVNDENRAKTLFAMGVDAVFSDCPERLLALSQT